jgi:pyruvate,water dikinase
MKVDEERIDAPCLTNDVIGELWQIARKLERHYGCPQDIEWAIPREPGPAGGGAVYLLQSRPETVWAKREKESKARPATNAFDHVVKLMSAGKDRS